MNNIFIAFLFLAINFSVFGQVSVVEWGSLQKTNSLLIDMIPKGDAAFFTLRISGGGIFSSYRMEQYDNLQLIKNVRIKTNTASGMGNLECLTFFGGKLRMLISDGDRENKVLYMQEYGDDMTAIGPADELASYSLQRFNSRPNYTVIKSQNNKFLSVIYEIPGRKEANDVFGYKIFDENMNIIEKGEITVPFEGALSSVEQHHITNKGSYFITLSEYEKGKMKIFSYFKEFHIYSVKGDEMVEHPLNLKRSRLSNLSITSNDDEVISINGTYGLIDGGNAAGVNGIISVKYDAKTDKILSDSYVPFSVNLITENWSDRQKEKLEKRTNKGKSKAPDLYSYVLRTQHALPDGSTVGSMEQYYVREVRRTDPKTGAVTYTYYYYYNDIIAYKINVNGQMEWEKRIPKFQVSVNDHGPYSSYFSYIDNGKLCFIFNDNKRNYAETGEYIREGITPYGFSLSYRKNVVALSTLDLATGNDSRQVMSTAKELSSIIKPKLFKYDTSKNEVLMYSIVRKKERFGIMKLH